jgi:PBP1b-binding outer membrane lipoprotein LpoB
MQQETTKHMKKGITLLVIILVLASCNNSADTKPSVGDSMDKDPQTGQPITTNPDTVGPNKNNTNQNH